MVTGLPQSLLFGWTGAPPRLVLLVAIFTKGVLILSYCVLCSHTQVNRAQFLNKKYVVACESTLLQFDWKQCFLALLKNPK